MNNWLDRLRASLALDGNRAGRCEGERIRGTQPGAARAGDRSPDIEAVHQALLAQPGQRSTAPPSLHRSIMEAVRGGNRSQVAGTRSMRLSWRRLPAPAVGIALLVGAFCWLHEPALKLPPAVIAGAAESLPKVGGVMQRGSEVTRTLPASALAPLAEEWQRVGLDLTNGAQTVLASLPVLY